MINKENTKSPQITSGAYLEEITILKRKIDRQEKLIQKIAKKAGVELTA
ncbi:MAG: hypothetical protein NT116_05515 [Candidatus Parcubacteria bacterium]|nr:hypothetical protein [Candidatus Parcubacteria bacterium]